MPVAKRPPLEPIQNAVQPPWKRAGCFASRNPTHHVKLAAMEWTDEGIVLGVRRHGKSSAIVELLTRERGRHLGLVRGGAGSRMRPLLQPGNSVIAVWRARLDEHLGYYRSRARGCARRPFWGRRMRSMALRIWLRWCGCCRSAIRIEDIYE